MDSDEDGNDKEQKRASSPDRSVEASSPSTSSTEETPRIELVQGEQADLLNLSSSKFVSIHVFFSPDLIHVSEDEFCEESHADDTSERKKRRAFTTLADKEKADAYRSLSRAFLRQAEKLQREADLHLAKADELSAADRHGASTSQDLRDAVLPEGNVQQADIQTSLRKDSSQLTSTSPGKTSGGVSQPGQQSLVTGSSKQADSAASTSSPSSSGLSGTRTVPRISNPLLMKEMARAMAFAKCSLRRKLRERKRIEKSRVVNTSATSSGSKAGPSNQTVSPGRVSTPSSSGLSEEQPNPEDNCPILHIMSGLAAEVDEKNRCGARIQSSQSENKAAKETPVQKDSERTSVIDEIPLAGALDAVLDALGETNSKLIDEKAELDAEIRELHAEIPDLQAEMIELQAEISRLKAELAELGAGPETGRSSRQAEALDVTLDALRKLNSRLVDGKAEMDAEVPHSPAEILELQSEISLFEPELAELGAGPEVERAEPEAERTARQGDSFGQDSEDD